MGYTLNTETGFLDLGASSVDIKGTYVTRLVAPCHVLYGDGRGGGGRKTPIDSALEQVRYHQSMPLAVAPYVLRRSVVGLQSFLHVDSVISLVFCLLSEILTLICCQCVITS